MLTHLDFPQDEAASGARTVVETLRKAGFEAYVVGGAVRSLVMGIKPSDYDVTTSAPPDVVLGLFRRTVPVGAQFGVVRVLMRGREYDVATFRADEGYSDGRRPDRVRFTDLAEDVRRRDFTMNALAMDPFTGEVIDLVNGIEDIRARLIKAVGDPRQRFAEDRLRPLRAVRFAAQTGFKIEEGTLDAIRELAQGVASVSAERVRDELHKILLSAHPGYGLRLLYHTGLAAVVLPELKSDFERIASTLDRLVGKEPDALWAALCLPDGPGAAEQVLARLRHSTRLRKAVLGIIRDAAAIRTLPSKDIAVEKRILRSDLIGKALDCLDAYSLSGGEGMESVSYARDRLSLWTKKDLSPLPLVTGHDALATGVKEGPSVARALTAIEDEQLRGNITTKEQALDFLRSFAKTRS